MESEDNSTEVSKKLITDPQDSSNVSSAGLTGTAWFLFIMLPVIIPGHHGYYNKVEYFFLNCGMVFVCYMSWRARRINPKDTCAFIVMCFSELVLIGFSVTGYMRMNKYFNVNMHLGPNKSVILIIGIVIILVGTYVLIRKTYSKDTTPEVITE